MQNEDGLYPFNPFSYSFFVLHSSFIILHFRLVFRCHRAGDEQGCQKGKDVRLQHCDEQLK
jgi:hypothetical protein